MTTTNANLERLLDRAMTVEDLIEELSLLDPKTPVFLDSDYGDISQTTQLLAVQTADEYDEDDVEETGYSQSGIALIDPADERFHTDQFNSDSRSYVVLGS